MITNQHNSLYSRYVMGQSPSLYYAPLRGSADALIGGGGETDIDVTYDATSALRQFEPDRCARFEGESASDAGVIVPAANAPTTTDSLFIRMWYRRDSSLGVEGVIGRMSSPGWRIASTPGYLELFIDTSAGSNQRAARMSLSSAGVDPTDGDWHLIEFYLASDNSVTMRIDGLEAVESTWSADIGTGFGTASTDLLIGRDSTNNACMTGAIHDVEVGSADPGKAQHDALYGETFTGAILPVDSVADSAFDATGTQNASLSGVTIPSDLFRPVLLVAITNESENSFGEQPIMNCTFGGEAMTRLHNQTVFPGGSVTNNCSLFALEVSPGDTGDIVSGGPIGAGVGSEALSFTVLEGAELPELEEVGTNEPGLTHTVSLPATAEQMMYAVFSHARGGEPYTLGGDDPVSVVSLDATGHFHQFARAWGIGGSTSINSTNSDGSTTHVRSAAVAVVLGAANAVAPVLTNDTAESVPVSKVSIQFDTDTGNGMAYAVVVDSDIEPSRDQVIAGQNQLGNTPKGAASQAVTQTGTQNLTVALSSPSGGTLYAGVVHVDADGNVSDSVFTEVAPYSGLLTGQGGSAARHPGMRLGLGL